MRNAFIETLTELARKDERVMCVIGDTGFSVFEKFEAEFKERFVNVGIAEQNFVSFGAGLAAMGMKPYIYNVASFMTLRAAEQIMLDICYQENPVVIVGVGGGYAYATAGPTHHALQDIATMCMMPNMTVVCPSDPIEMKALMRASLNYESPLYIRLGRSVDPVIHSENIDFQIGKALCLKEGEDAVLFATGTMVKDALKVCEILKERNLNITLYDMHTIKPIDEEAIILSAESHKALFTLEEHSIIGGLGDAVLRVLSKYERKNDLKFRAFGVKDEFAPLTGTRDYLNHLAGIDPESVADSIYSMVN